MRNLKYFDFLSLFLGILKVKPRDQCLFSKENTIMQDEKTLFDYNITISSAKAQSPAQLGLALRCLSD